MATIRCAGTITAIVLIYLGDPSTVEAVEPAPDGRYPSQNTAEGNDALLNLSTGSGDTALGFQALFHNTSGVDNTATGSGALFSNTTGYDNTASGASAMQSNTMGFFNTAAGNFALFSNTTGYDNVATGLQALNNSTTGFFNTATGNFSLFSLTTGSQNTANGVATLVSNSIGNNNTAEGVNALFNALGSNNIAIGFEAGTDLVVGDNNIDIGNRSLVNESNAIRIGTKGTHTTTFIAGISGAAVTGSPVVVSSNGKLGIATSSARFKEAIRPMEQASSVLLGLEPVTFRYKREIDEEGISQFGLIAEDVEKVEPALVTRDADGKANSVRYDAVNAMLLNEFLKEHRTVEQQGATIARLQEQVDALIAKLERITEQVQARKPSTEAASTTP